MNKEKFAFRGISLFNPKMIINAMQAQCILSNRCVGFLATIFDKTKEVKIRLKDVYVVRSFIKVFLDELPSLLP